MAAIGNGVTHSVVGNGLAGIRYELILPTRCRIGIVLGFNNGTYRALGDRILSLIQNIACGVVGKDPRVARYKVVLSRQLTQLIVYVGALENVVLVDMGDVTIGKLSIPYIYRFVNYAIGIAPTHDHIKKTGYPEG